VKFLCDNCKAKYQIADEKVAGKTVRMKCRKCGHQIEVRAAVTASSVSGPPPKPPTPSMAPRPPQKGGLATSLSATKPRAPSPSVAPSGALAGAFKSNVTDDPASIPADRPSAQIELSVTDEWYVAINGVPVGPVRISELRRKAAAGAVTEESLCWQEGLEEWRPIRSIPELASLVREAAQGNRPSMMGSSPDGAPPPPAPRSPSETSPARQTGPVAPHRPSAAPPAPAPRPTAPAAPAAPQRSNVVPFRPAASSGLDEIPISPVAPIGGAGSAAALAPSLTPAPTPIPVFTATPIPAPIPAPIAPVADPFAVPPAAPAPAPLGALTSPYRAPDNFDRPNSGSASIAPPPPSVAYESQKKGVPLWFWPILLLALGFGGGIAFLVFRPQPPPAPVVIQMPTPTAPTATAPPDNGADTPPPASAEPAIVTASNEPKAKTGPVAKGLAPKPAETQEKKGLDLGNLVPGGGGPNVGPNPSPGAGGGGLDQAGVERVVQAHRTGVKRTCWERGGADQKSSVNVTVTANVAPNGSVSSTSSSGDDPVVAKCIESQVKTWQFPAPGSNTTLNIPFKFVRQ
jgi:predicted Zn finger-like uncharacterized protein